MNFIYTNTFATSYIFASSYPLKLFFMFPINPSILYLILYISLYSVSDEICIFKIGDGVHNKVRTKERREEKKIYEGNKEIYKMRYNIEGLIGDIKNSFKGYEEAKIYEVANVFVYIKFIAYYDKIDIYFLLYICGHYAIFFEQPK